MAAEITLFSTWPRDSTLSQYRVRLLDGHGVELARQVVSTNSVIFGYLDELTDYQIELVAYSLDTESNLQLMSIQTPEAETTTSSLRVEWEEPVSGDAVRVLNNRKEVIQDLGVTAPPQTVSGLTRHAHNYIELTRADGTVELFWFYTPPKTLPDVESTLVRLTRGDGWNPHPTPVPNPTAIQRSGRSTEQDNVVRTLGHFDQRDGSGGSHLSPAGVVSQPDRQGRISGNTTDQNGNPVSRRVRCFERKTGRIVRETWSNAAGYYQFDDLDPNKRFTILAHDYTGEFNAVVADNAQPEVL